MAKPCPARVPPEYLMRDSALCPQITPGMAAKIEKQTRLRIPKTKLQTARAEVLGGRGLLLTEGSVSLIPHVCGCVLKVNLQVYLAELGNGTDGTNWTHETYLQLVQPLFGFLACCDGGLRI